MKKVSAIIVTHNSERVLPRCIEALQRQTQPVDRIILVDSGSQDISYLEVFVDFPKVTLLLEDNIGFSAANNLGAAQAPSFCDFILFMNPDTFLDPGFIKESMATMHEHPEAGALSGKILWYDVASDMPTRRLDSAGVFRAWYGRWYDRGQGNDETGRYCNLENVPAVCGALMFCRRSALQEVMLSGNKIFDPDFFMYKEDIELCLRLRKFGWDILYQPLCIAWHGRGWGRIRQNIPRRIRKMAAENEVLLYKKHPSPYMIWAFFKYFLVSAFNV